MVRYLTLFMLLMLFSAASAQTVPFTIQGPGIDPNDFEITVFADGLNFPVGMTELSDGSILVATSNGPSFFTTTTGSLRRLADTDGDGVADVEQTLVGNVPGGKLTSVRRAGDIIAVVGQGQSVPISLYRTGAEPDDALTFLGQLDFNYPNGGWLHPQSALALRERPGHPGQYELYFQLGSDANFQTTTRTVSLGGTLGLSATLAGDALHRVILDDTGESFAATAHEQIATGLRNASGLAFHPETGDLYIGENGIDGVVDPNEPTSADELNVIASSDLGGAIEDFGFPSTYEEYRTGNTIGSTGIAPTVIYQPLPPPNGEEAEGVNDIAFAPPTFPAAAQGVFAGFHGIFSLSGLSNEENAVALADPETGDFFHFISNDEAGVGHLDGLLSTADTLYLADISPPNGFASRAGAIYAIRVPARIPGDYDGDGLVTAADYTVWRDTLGQTGAGLAADGDGNNVVDQGDYTVWRDNFGVGGATSASGVPEPATLLLLLTWMLTPFRCRT